MSYSRPGNASRQLFRGTNGKEALQQLHSREYWRFRSTSTYKMPIHIHLEGKRSCYFTKIGFWPEMSKLTITEILASNAFKWSRRTMLALA